uniref:Choline transporter-like protein n=1 Tax=Timema californicum TaxID=61474 RepID=A0A7R9JGA8_TIMCA|nr:unnamed protein product [Timema californicum]
MDVRHVSQSMKICVKKCPDHNLETLGDIQTFYQREHSLLCRYDFDFNLLTSQHLSEKDKNMAFSSKLGPCPSLPVYNSRSRPLAAELDDACPGRSRMSLHEALVGAEGKPPPVHPTEIRTSISPSLSSRAQHDKRINQLRHRGGVPVLNRCIPRPVKDLADQVFSGLYSVLNSWDTVEQVLGDLYTAWKEITALMLVAFVLSLAMIGVIHWLASFVAWIFMLAVTVAAIAGTGILWWTFADMKSSLDKTPDNQLLDESVRNSRAFLVYSIVATIITVIIILLVFAVRKSIGFMSQLFEESAECLADLPALFLQPFVTFIALLAFFSFWLYVVVCLATSSYPGSESYFPFSGSGPTPTSSPRQELSSLKVEGTEPPKLNISLAGIKCT